MKNYLFYLILLFINFSCKEKVVEKVVIEKTNSVRNDIRFLTGFYSINISEDGKAFAVKGKGSYYTEPLKIESADTSLVFKLDSVKIFYDLIKSVREKPVLGPFRYDAHRVEIYFNEEKIYDSYAWDEKMWDLFKPIMAQIPLPFNPFIPSDTR